MEILKCELKLKMGEIWKNEKERANRKRNILSKLGVSSPLEAKLSEITTKIYDQLIMSYLEKEEKVYEG